MDAVRDDRSDGSRNEAGCLEFGDRSKGEGNLGRGGRCGVHKCNKWRVCGDAHFRNICHPNGNTSYSQPLYKISSFSRYRDILGTVIMPRSGLYVVPLVSW